MFAHHGNTPQGIGLAVEHAIRNDLARFVICTSTLAQGVNLPIRYLLVTSLYQDAERIKVRDFHNLIGRAGSAGMHTEGSILFADADIYDKRKSHVDKWRWTQVKELPEPANSEPCISSLLSFFEPLHSEDRRYSLKLNTFDFLNRHIEDPHNLAELAETVARDHGDKGFTKQGLDTEIALKSNLIAAVESFLTAQWDAAESP
jgi:POLQ-like helicase